MIPVEDKIVLKKISEIRPYARNPRNNQRTVELLCKLIPKVGFNVPIVIDEKGIIVKGHARYASAIRLGMEEVPCIVTHADEESIKVDRITDNKISEFSEWINEDVLSEIESIDTDIDFSELGFPVAKLDALPSWNDYQEVAEEKKQSNIEPVANKPKKVKRYYKCICNECGHVMFVDEDEVG